MSMCAPAEVVTAAKFHSEASLKLAGGERKIIGTTRHNYSISPRSMPKQHRRGDRKMKHAKARVLA